MVLKVMYHLDSLCGILHADVSVAERVGSFALTAMPPPGRGPRSAGGFLLQRYALY